MKFFKKIGIGAYILAVALVLVIVSLIMVTKDYNLAYYASNIKLSLTLYGVLPIILICAYLVLSSFKFSEKRVVSGLLSALVIVSGLLFTLLIFGFLRDRVYDFAVVLGSDLELGNQNALDAVHHSIATLVAMFIGLFFLIVGSFFSVRRLDKTEEVVAA